MNQKDLIDKIVKLLELANSTPYPEEAKSAKAKATKLMADWQIKEGDLYKDEEIIIHTIETNRQRPSSIKSWLLAVVCRHTGVSFFIRQTYHKQYNIVGRKTDIEICIYLFECIDHQLETLARNYKKENKATKSQLHQYKQGLILGVQEFFEVIAKDVIKYKEQEGLVPVNTNDSKRKEAEDFFKQNNRVNKARNRKITYSKHTEKGVCDASDIKINAAVENQNKQQSIGV
jgi:hypothetical protein